MNDPHANHPSEGLSLGSILLLLLAIASAVVPGYLYFVVSRQNQLMLAQAMAREQATRAAAEAMLGQAEAPEASNADAPTDPEPGSLPSQEPEATRSSLTARIAELEAENRQLREELKALKPESAPEPPIAPALPPRQDAPRSDPPESG